MNVGLYTTSLKPKGRSQQRFQDALFKGLESIGGTKYKFFVLSHDAQILRVGASDYLTHIPLPSSRLHNLHEAGIALTGAIMLRLSGITGLTASRRLTYLKWKEPTPAYFRKLHDLNIRLVWNVNQHTLATDLPFVRTIWDVNHRIHSMYPEYSRTRFRFSGLDYGLSESLAKASYVVVGTEIGKNELVTLFGVHPDKIRVIPFPTPDLTDAIKESDRSSPIAIEGPYFLYPAHFWPHKNHVVIVDALRILRKRWGLTVKCVFCGYDEGNLAYVQRYAERSGVSDSIIYTGVVSEAALVSLYRNAQALTYVSAVGPDNLPPLEAMALGCPVIASDVSGAREQYGEAVRLFATHDSGDLAQAMREVIQSDSARACLIAKGYGRARAWSVSDFARKVLEVLDEFSEIAKSWETSNEEFG
jgi:glycosyltransferase involved in cell wall biosynthesis